MDSKGNDVEGTTIPKKTQSQDIMGRCQGGFQPCSLLLRSWSEEWKIDFSKLDIQKVVAHGTYRTVFKGTYHKQAVAGGGGHAAFYEGGDEGEGGGGGGGGSSSSSWSEEWKVGFSKLNIKKVVAHWNYRSVYKGTYHKQAVTVKVLEWGEGPALWESFRQKVDAWHKLDHPNVTKLVGASMGATNLKIPSKVSSMVDQNSISSKACCVVVEYIRGETLKELLIRYKERKLPFKDVIRLALDLSRGLSYLHSNNIVHHDVRIENMLIDAHRTLKIADVGIAGVKPHNPRDMIGKTGTIEYMAPQVLEGNLYDMTCDVYSFGICLWEIYCCDNPYPGLSFADLSSAVAHQNLRPNIPEWCPNSLANVMRKCWDDNPSKRPEMHEVVKMLEAIDTSKGGGIVSTHQVSWGFCFRPFGMPSGP